MFNSMWVRFLSLWSLGEMFAFQVVPLMEFCLCVSISWCPKRSRYFSCRDKEQIYYTFTTTHWLLPCHAKCTLDKTWCMTDAKNMQSNIILHLLQNTQKQFFFLMQCNSMVLFLVLRTWVWTNLQYFVAHSVCSLQLAPTAFMLFHLHRRERLVRCTRPLQSSVTGIELIWRGAIQ